MVRTAKDLPVIMHLIEVSLSELDLKRVQYEDQSAGVWAADEFQ